MPIYTFITERGGGTYISQHDEPTLMDAWQAFVADEDMWSGIPLATPLDDWMLLVAVDTVKSVWCTSAHDKDDNFVLINIVKTDISGPVEGPEM